MAFESFAVALLWRRSSSSVAPGRHRANGIRA